MATVDLDISCSDKDDRRNIHLVHAAVSVNFFSLSASDLRTLGEGLVNEADEMDATHRPTRGDLLKLLEEIRHRIVPHADQLQSRIDDALGLVTEEID